MFESIVEKFILLGCSFIAGGAAVIIVDHFRKK